MRKSLLIVFLLAASAALGADNPSVEMTWGVKIPMRDGVHLNATVYRPANQPSPLPVIFTLTPYLADSYLNRATYFAKNGYVFALVDVRGRGNSEGKFDPFAQEDRDGFDAVEWLAKQPWSNGKVTMWGGSYAGFDQWATLKEHPPHLKTIVPVASVHPGIDFPFANNIFYPYDMQWLTYTSGAAPNINTFGDSAFWIDRFRALYLQHRPFSELDTIVGNPSAVFQEWLKHPAPDAYLDSMVPTQAQFHAIDVPILTITGDYDGDQLGAMAFYRDAMRYGTADAAARHYLIIGPWDHPGTRTPKKEVGGLTFGDASLLDLNKLHKEWYDWTLKDGAKPEFLKKRVAYYVTGADEWKYADSLEAIGAKMQTLYLTSGGNAGDVFHSGALIAAGGGGATDHYVYDPLDVRPAEIETEDVANSLTDQRYALNLYGAGVVYHSEPFAEATELTGNVRLTASIAIDVPDTDFGVSLYEIKSDGSSVLLTSDNMRARYRESIRKETLAKPGEINRYLFDHFTFVSRRIAKASRLRLVLGAGNSIYTEKNYNSGGVVANESAKDAKTAHVTIYHDAQYPSFIELPIVR
jgi:putative CocE/NonD family hydrolase